LQVESGDPVPDEVLEAGGERNPYGEAEDRSAHGADESDDRSVGDHGEANLTVGRTERTQHAERPEPALCHDGEPRSGDEADEQEADGLHRKHGRRDGVLAGGRAGSDADRVPRRPERVDALAGRVEQDGDPCRRVGLARGDERELVAQVQGVLDESDHAAAHAVRFEGVANVHAERRRGIGRHRDVSGTGRKATG
jgi:hypothetical protein